MNDYIKIRRLALKYRELSFIKALAIMKINKTPVFKKLYMKRAEVNTVRELRRIVTYILLYEAVFEKTLKMLDTDSERELVDEVCRLGKSVNKTAIDAYASPSAVERALKKFTLYFISNLSASRRIILPLSTIRRK